MASIWKHPRSRFYYCEYVDADGKRVQQSTKQEDRKAAQRVANEWEDAAASGRAKELTITQAQRVLSRTLEVAGVGTIKKISINDALENWETHHRGKWSPATTVKYQKVIKTLVDFLGEERVKAQLRTLNKQEIRSWRDDEMAQGKSASTADGNVVILRAAFNWLIDEDFAAENPASKVKPHSMGGSESREPFTDEEMRSILLACDKEWLGMTLFGAWHSLRLADAANLTWGNIDTERWTLAYVPKKTRRKNVEPLVLVLAHDLVTYLGSITKGAPEAPLFPGLYGKPSGSHGGLSMGFSRIMAKAGIVVPLGRKKEGKGRQFRRKGFHSLRHYSISRMLEAGIEGEARRLMGGHSINSTAHTRYLHLRPEAQREALAKMGALTNGGGGTGTSEPNWSNQT